MQHSILVRCISSSFLLPLALAAGACSSSVNAGPTTDAASESGNGDDAAAPAGGRAADADAATNPRNPTGLGPAPVSLGTAASPAAAGAYVVLAQTAVTNVTGTAISGGDVGLSPAAASFITGFGLVMDNTNVFAASVSVVAPGKVYAADYAPPTPAALTTAVAAMRAAYADAAGRTNPDFTNLASGNIGGRTLAPGLYTWDGDVTIPNDVTVAGAAGDVWIFQVANTLDLASARNVILSGGALAKNVFWQVAGSVTIHANAHFEGIILGKTDISLQTSASMHGRALAQTLVALDNNAVTAP
jgi:hypothetical protein